VQYGTASAIGARRGAEREHCRWLICHGPALQVFD